MQRGLPRGRALRETSGKSEWLLIWGEAEALRGPAYRGFQWRGQNTWNELGAFVLPAIDTDLDVG